MRRSLQKVKTGELKHRFGHEILNGGKLAPVECIKLCSSSFKWHSVHSFSFQGSFVLQLLSSVASSISPTARRTVDGPTGALFTDVNIFERRCMLSEVQIKLTKNILYKKPKTK